MDCGAAESWTCLLKCVGKQAYPEERFSPILLPAILFSKLWESFHIEEHSESLHVQGPKRKGKFRYDLYIPNI